MVQYTRLTNGQVLDASNINELQRGIEDVDNNRRSVGLSKSLTNYFISDDFARPNTASSADPFNNGIGNGWIVTGPAYTSARINDQEVITDGNVYTYRVLPFIPNRVAMRFTMPADSRAVVLILSPDSGLFVNCAHILLTHNSLSIQKLVGGSFTHLTATSITSLRGDGKYHEFAWEIVGGVLSTYIDGIKINESSDADLKNMVGKYFTFQEAHTDTGSASPRITYVEASKFLTPAIVSVADYGAVGNGTIDDTEAIINAITAAGIGGTLRFEAGKTYMHTRRLEPLQGQKWQGMGATIKRAAELVTTTTTGITAGAAPKSVTVTSAAGFTIGMSVSFKNGSTQESGYHVITNIVGNVVTLDTNFPDTWAIGSQMIRSFPQISTFASNVVIENLIVDGNYSQNTTYARWEVSANIRLNSPGAVIRDCTFQNAQADAVMVDNSYITIENCRIIGARGNGIHLSAASYCRIIGNTLEGTNLGNGATIGHADGAIVASNDVTNTIVTHNIINGALAGIASWDSVDDSYLICTNNIIRNCTAYAFEAVLPSATSVSSIDFSHNQIYDCVELGIYSTHGATPRDTGPAKFRITDNIIHNTKVLLSNTFDLAFVGNTMTRSSVNMLLEFGGGRNVRIDNNIFRGGNQAIYHTGGTIGGTITNNLFTDQLSYAMRFEAAVGVGFMVANNTIIAADTPNSGWYGIYAGDGLYIMDNLIVNTAAVAQVGIYAPPLKGVIARNTLRQQQGTSISIPGGSTGITCVDNLTTTAVSGTGTGTNVLNNNRILSAL